MKFNSNCILKTCVCCIIYVASAGFLFMLGSCTEHSSLSDPNLGPSPDEVKHIYSHYIKGQYSDFIKHIASCENKPRFYREQIINLYRQHDEQRMQEVGPLDSISVRKIEVSPHTQHAKVFIIHHYQKAAPEEIVLQMVFDQNKWKMK